MRVIALTGMGQQTDIARTREAGFHAHLTKPADPRAVAELVAEADAAGMASMALVSSRD